jgi:hypothetical protein
MPQGEAKGNGVGDRLKQKVRMNAPRPNPQVNGKLHWQRQRSAPIISYNALGSNRQPFDSPRPWRLRFIDYTG